MFYWNSVLESYTWITQLVDWKMDWINMKLIIKLVEVKEKVWMDNFNVKRKNN